MIVFVILYLDYCTNEQNVSLVISLGSKVQYRFVTFSTESIKTTFPFITVFVRYVSVACFWFLIPPIVSIVIKM